MTSFSTAPVSCSFSPDWQVDDQLYKGGSGHSMGLGMMMNDNNEDDDDEDDFIFFYSG